MRQILLHKKQEKRLSWIYSNEQAQLVHSVKGKAAMGWLNVLKLGAWIAWQGIFGTSISKDDGHHSFVPGKIAMPFLQIRSTLQTMRLDTAFIYHRVYSGPNFVVLSQSWFAFGCFDAHVFTR